MRHSAVLWGLAAALVLAGGCERREDVEEPKAYDPATDSPPSTIVVEPNPLLLANQVEIAKKVPKPTARAAAGPAEATGESVEGVKTTLLRLLDAAEAKQPDAVAAFFLPQDAEAVGAILAAAPVLEQKMATLNRLLHDKFGMEPLPVNPLGGTGTGGMSGLSLPSWITRTTLMADPSPLQFATQGDKVTVSRGGQEPLTLANVSGTWKIEPNPQERLAIGMSAEVVQATGTIIDATIAGINNGTITKDNFRAKTQAMAEQYLTPIMTKFVAAAQGTTGGGAGAGGTVALTPTGGTAAGPEMDLDVVLPDYPAERDDPGHLEVVTTMWQSNSFADALGHFVWIKWDKPAELGRSSLYAISQLRFAAMSEPQRAGLTEQATAQIRILKEMAARLSEMAARQAAAGDTATAQKYVRAIAGCATFLQQPRRLAVLREGGAAIAQMPDPLSGGTPIAPVVALARPGEGPADPGYLEDVAILWVCKEKDQALKEFLRIDWKRPAVLTPDSAFLLTDDQVLAMTLDDREALMDEVTGLDRALRDLANYAISQAKTDTAKAKRYVDALAGLASFLQQEQYMLVLRVRGEATARLTSPVTNQPVGTGPPPPPNVVPKPPTSAPAPVRPPARAPAPTSPEENVNAGRGPGAAQQVRDQLLAPTRRLTGGGD